MQAVMQRRYDVHATLYNTCCADHGCSDVAGLCSLGVPCLPGFVEFIGESIVPAGCTAAASSASSGLLVACMDAIR